jgi:hypothetical protein
MSNLDDSFTKLLGRQPSDAERQRLYQVRDALGLRNNDALWLVLIALQHYEQLYAGIPDRIEAAAKKAARSAAAQAQADVNSAIAGLIPTVESAVRDGARWALAQESLVRSMFTLIAGCVVVGVVFAIGVLYGARIFAVAAAGQLGWMEFWTQIGWSLALGTAAPGLLLIGVMQIDDERAWWQYLALVLAVVAVAVPAIRLILLLVT